MSSLQGYIFYISVFQPVLGTCAIFSATEVLAQTKTGGTRRGGAKVKNYGAVAVARKKVALIRAILEPILHRNLK